ncbi:MAG: MFS transporter [Candidatus Marinimicrobia bacterium]|nr:MFS transporter [Candidatus Neomarinimicrobiota bacterium]
MTSKQVERRYLVIAGIYNLSASLIWGINTLFLLNAGLDIFEVFITNGVFTASMSLFEIPTGVLADTRGRRASFLLSVVIILIGTLGYVWVAESSGSLMMFNLMSVILGLGYTFYSGAVDAWLVDALAASGYKGELDQVFARGGIVFGAAMLVGTLGGGLLGTINLSLPYLVRALLLGGVFVVAWRGMHDMGYEPRTMILSELPGEMKKIASASMRHGWQVQGIKLLMLASMVQAFFFAWGYHSWQPYFLGLLQREDAIWIAGIIAALIAVSMMIGNALVGWLGRKFRLRTSLLIGGTLLIALAAVAVGLANNFYLAVGLYLLTGVAFGIIGPTRMACMHKMIPSEQRATIISFDSLVGNVGSVGGQVGLGYLARQQSLGMGYITGGLVTLLSLPILLVFRALRMPEDQMNGNEQRTVAGVSQE